MTLSMPCSHFGVRPDDKELAVVLTDFDPGGSHLVKLQSILLALNVSLTATRRTLLVKVPPISGEDQ